MTRESEEEKLEWTFKKLIINELEDKLTALLTMVQDTQKAREKWEKEEEEEETRKEEREKKKGEGIKEENKERKR